MIKIKKALVDLVIDSQGKELTFKFEKLSKSDIDWNSTICDTVCPYGENGKCQKIIDPRYPNDYSGNHSFDEFCEEIDEDESWDIANLVPLPGSIEAGFGDMKYKIEETK